MRDELAGWLTLLRLALRRDRVLLSAWVLGLAAMAGFSAAATVDLYPTEESRVQAAETINASAAVVALYGRIYDPTSLGAVSMVKLTALGAAIVGIVMLFVAIRHTRGEEEPGRLELLSGGRLGRLAPLTAALVLIVSSCLVLGVLTALFNTAAGLPFSGSLAFGLGWAATGMVYGAVGLVTAQLATGARAARGLGLVVVAVTYALRAVGDLAEPGPSFLSWLSPIGWNQQLRAYAGDRWWVLLLPLLAVALLVPAAYALRSRRDLGAGLREDRPGPATGRLASVEGLAWRLHSRVLLAWAVAFVVFPALLGSLAGSVDQLLTSQAMRDFFASLGGTAALVDVFLGAEISIMAAIAAAYGISAADRMRAEESEGRAELLLATPATRVRWATGHYAVALGGSALLLVLAGLFAGVTAAASVGDRTLVGTVLVAALAQVPAAWVVTSLVMLAFGWLPRATVAVWGLLAAFVVVGEFGSLWKLPEWVMDLSPLRHAPSLPVGADGVAPVLWLLLATVVISALGYVGWRRRDLVA
ncbi:MAG: ABC transporter permease [Frankiales bacterium]|nr:ABC transporter permease [Frankiales bacterium]